MKLEYIFFFGVEWFDYDWLGYINVFFCWSRYKEKFNCFFSCLDWKGRVKKQVDLPPKGKQHISHVSFDFYVLYHVFSSPI